MIFVRVEFGALFQDQDGSVHALDVQPDGTWDAVSDSLYRLNRWQGLLKRNLVRVSGYGREFWIDVMAMRIRRVLDASAGLQARAKPWVVVAKPGAVKRGCGCGKG